MANLSITSPDESIRRARRDLAAALRMADRLGFGEGVCNHFSFAVPGADGLFLINPRRLHWSEVTASGLLLVDDNGALIEGDEPPEASAFYIHWRLHKAAPQAKCVLHTHMPYATALTMLEDPTLLPLSQTSLMFHNEVSYDTAFNGLAGHREEGDRIATALGNRSTLFLANHGVIVTGGTVPLAWNRLYYLERAAMHQVMALSTGKPLRVLPEDMAGKTRQQLNEDEADMAENHFRSVHRILERECPEYLH